MRSGLLLLSLALTFLLHGSASATTGSGTVDFNFTGFSGAFAWADPGTENNPSLGPNNIVGTVNGVVPAFNGSEVDRGLFGQFIIGGDAQIGGTTATMVRGDPQGQQLPNVIQFTPVSFSNITTGQPFELGTLSFTNGAWFGGTGNMPVNLSFTIQTHSSTPEFNQLRGGEFTMVTNTRPSGSDCSDPAIQKDEADFVYLNDSPALGSLRVYEAFCPITASPPQTGSIELWFRFGSLDPDSLRNVQGDAFYSTSTAIGPLGVPEPSTWMLMLAGVGALGWAVRRQRLCSDAMAARCGEAAEGDAGDRRPQHRATP